MPRKPGFTPPPKSETAYPGKDDYADRAPALMPLPMSPAEFRSACRSRIPSVLSALDRILADPTSSATSVLNAAAQIADRAYGKPAVVAEVDPNRSVEEMTTAELWALQRAELEANGVDVDAVLAKERAKARSEGTKAH